MKPKLESTSDYSLFQMNRCNRPLRNMKPLEESMRKHGFMPSSPIHCRSVKGKLVVIRGHHRLSCAKRLGLPVYYIVDESDVDLRDLEGAFRQVWSVEDFVVARARGGSRDCQAVLEFQREHDLAIGATISLLGGENATSGNKQRAVKRGTFKLGTMEHAEAVVAVTDLCRELGLPFATQTAFVGAISMVLRVPEVEGKVLCDRIRLNPQLLKRCSRVDDYLEQIETTYNYKAQSKRIPLKFRAREVGRQRQATFGRGPQSQVAVSE